MMWDTILASLEDILNTTSLNQWFHRFLNPATRGRAIVQVGHVHQVSIGIGVILCQAQGCHGRRRGLIICSAQLWLVLSIVKP